ncbi:MAG: NAD(P)H-dependent flavin oxidoreductase [Promethearchaeota archaeon]
MIKTIITDMFGIKYPIFSAPMGPFTNKNLTACVSEAGGLGVLSHVGLVGVDPLPEMKKHMEYVVEYTDKPFGFNVRTSRAEKWMAERLCREIPEFIQKNTKIKEQCIYTVTSAGSSKVMPNSKTFQKLKESGSQIRHFHVAPAFWLAEKCVQYSVDGLCVTGIEGGGHQSYEKVGSNVLLAQVQQAFPEVLKIAAGGYGSGAGLASALAMGAEGIVMGTRFIASHECNFPYVYKNLIPKAKAKEGVLIQGILANIRVYNNDFAKHHHGGISKKERLNYEKTVSKEQLKEDALKYDRVYDGDVVNTCVPMGQSAGLVHEIESVSDIMENIVKECEVLLKNAVRKIT